jgi:NADPH:quinone reductase-like Zn-dependent oxidoreductase
MPIATRLHRFGPPADSISIAEIEDRMPSDGEVAVAMLAAPINPADINVIEGKYGDLPELPATIGNEGVGRIAALGPHVDGLHVGQLVLPMAFGTWTQRMIVPADTVVPLPDSLDVRQAAMLTVNPATAWRLLHDFVTLQPGEWIVQNAANSGVGRSVIQLARALGFKTLNVVRRTELIDDLLAAGADRVVLEDTDLRATVDSLCDGCRPRLALNSVGGPSALNIANALARNGCHVTFGAMSRLPLKIPNGLVIFSNLTFRGFWLKRWRETASPDVLRSTYATLATHLEKRTLHTPVDAVFPLGQLPSALDAASREKRAGKILLDLTSPPETVTP